MLIRNRVRKTSRGFTITELMMGAALSSILVIGLVTLLTGMIRYNKETVALNRFNQDLINVLNLMSRDIRRAGYWGNAATDVGTAAVTNPFMATATILQTGAGGTCMLMAYDSNKDGTLAALGTTGDDERYGYRLNSTTKAVQMRIPTSDFSCTGGSWVNITDPVVYAIDSLQFNLTSQQTNIDSVGSRINQRGVQINMTARHLTYGSLVKNFSHSVKIRNDTYILNY